MTKIQFDLSKKANNILAKFAFYNSLSSKQEAAEIIISRYNVSEDFKEWIKKQDEAEE